MKRKLKLGDDEITIRFHYGEPDKNNPERSYTERIELKHGPNKGIHYCRFVECRIEKRTLNGWETLSTAKSICSPADQFNKFDGRVKSLCRAVEKLGLDDKTARMIRVYGIGDQRSIDRYNERNGIVDDQKLESVES